MGTAADRPDSGTPPGTTPGTAPPSTGTQGDAGAPPAGTGSGIDRTKLNPILQGLGEAEINDLFDTMVMAVRRGEPAPAAPPPPAPAVPEPDYRQMFDPSSDSFNPVEGVRQIAQKNFGPLVSDIARKATEGSFMKFRSVYPDFQDYEEDVRKALAASPNPSPSDAEINGVYLAAKGWRQTLRERNEREAAKTRPPSPPKVDEAPVSEPLSDEEKQVARRMFRNNPDPEKAYRDYAAMLESGNTTMKVPLSGGARR